ncbi:MAG: hypothetical protein RG741_01405 [Bacteroidales bacterium]|nr:hypothetical protein [Bacteroidales bacterium]
MQLSLVCVLSAQPRLALTSGMGAALTSYSGEFTWAGQACTEITNVAGPN